MSIILSDVSKTFGEKRVLSGVSLRFDSGGSYCIKGPSGQGKTTLLKVIMGLIIPDAGSVDCMGHAFAPVFQEDRLCENLSAGANIRMVLREPRDVEGMLNRLGLPGTMKTPVKELSGGMRRRVCIARALLSGRDTLIFDEPLSGLDAAAAENVMDVILAEKVERTLLWVSHDEDHAAYMKSEIVTL